MKSLTKARSSVSSLALFLMVLSALTLALGASAQRQRPAKKRGSSATADKRSRGGSKANARTEQHEARKKNAPKRKPASKKKSKSAETEVETEAPANDVTAATTALQNRRTLEDDKHLTRTAVIVRIGELAKAGWRKAGEEEEAATKRAAALAETATRLDKMEGERHRKTLARFQVWSAALEKGDTVPALVPADAAPNPDEEAPEADAADAKPKPKNKKATTKPKKRNERAKPRGRDGSRTRGSAPKKSSGGRRR